jgi:hypothetical protein
MYTTDTQIIQKVLALVGWNTERRNQVIYNSAERYLTGFMPSYPQIVGQLMKDPIFWKWWMGHWEMRDKEFLELNETGCDNAEELYLELHDPRTLVEAIYLNGQVLEESYAKMIGEVSKAQKMEVAA